VRALVLLLAFDVKSGDGMYLPPDQRISLW
jgi:predicted metalloendopeptidase